MKFTKIALALGASVLLSPAGFAAGDSTETVTVEAPSTAALSQLSQRLIESIGEDRAAIEELGEGVDVLRQAAKDVLAAPGHRDTAIERYQTAKILGQAADLMDGQVDELAIADAQLETALIERDQARADFRSNLDVAVEKMDRILQLDAQQGDPAQIAIVGAREQALETLANIRALKDTIVDDQPFLIELEYGDVLSEEERAALELKLTTLLTDLYGHSPSFSDDSTIVLISGRTAFDGSDRDFAQTIRSSVTTNDSEDAGAIALPVPRFVMITLGKPEAGDDLVEPETVIETPAEG